MDSHRKQKITSREYKLVLNASRFAGEESDLITHAGQFWMDLENTILSIGGDLQGKPDQVSSKKIVRFIDTRDNDLYRKNYIFRHRRSLQDDPGEVTLKFRHPDEYVAKPRNMESRKSRDRKIKFEHDIKAPFQQLCSFSSTCLYDRAYASLEDIIRQFRGLADEFDEYTAEKNVGSVYNKDILEIVINGGALEIGRSERINAECALISWYDSENPTDVPLIVEFSFRYGHKKGKYHKQVAEDAYRLFSLIREEMHDWMGPELDTKTSLIYNSRQV